MQDPRGPRPRAPRTGQSATSSRAWETTPCSYEPSTTAPTIQRRPPTLPPSPSQWKDPTAPSVSAPRNYRTAATRPVWNWACGSAPRWTAR
ncbi:hypothetical protein ACFFX0_27145 [Citricoccus parietis]|uniref:Uncharacterized protein n=1 Tax=Citricoccus parietis TaxID=592307 RepID=A0ABV5G6T0_9MICC